MSDGTLPLVRAVRDMSATRRLLLLGGAGVAVVAVWFVGTWASQPTFVALYSGLELTEASQIADHLGKSDIRYRLAGGGTEIQVPTSDMARARVALAKDGLPMNGRPGLELFDKPSWGMTDFTQRVTYQRAIEGELARTIGGLRGIAKAQVHLVLPTPSPLRRDERPPAAAVVLALAPSAALSPDAIQGITYIVSNSVEGLSADNVAVMDDAGHVLSVPSLAGAPGLTSRQLDIQGSVEKHLVEKIENLLATVVGLGRARAQVSAQLSFEQVDRTLETFDPDAQVLQNEQKSEGGAGEGGGSPTIVNNTYQNSRKLEKIIGSVGNVQRLTVAVLVDDKAMQAGTPPGGAALKIANLEAMVRNAIGVDSTRGDRVTVMAVPFEPTAITGVPGGAFAAEAPKTDAIVVVERLSRPLVGLVAIAALVLLALRVLPLLGARSSPGSGGAREGPPTEAAGGGEILPMRRAAGESGERVETTAQVLKAWLADSSS